MGAEGGGEDRQQYRLDYAFATGSRSESKRPNDVVSTTMTADAKR